VDGREDQNVARSLIRGIAGAEATQTIGSLEYSPLYHITSSHSLIPLLSFVHSYSLFSHSYSLFSHSYSLFNHCKFTALSTPSSPFSNQPSRFSIPNLSNPT
jgi:phosphate/sulfate permease